jgi:hypothetical protein
MLKKLYKSELSYIILLLGLGLSVLFWKILFLGHVQVPADILFHVPVMQEAAPDGFRESQNILLSDHVCQFYIWHHLAAESMQNGKGIPLWNPYIWSGQPLLANSQSALFYPPNLLLFWFDPGLVASIRVFFNIFVAGIFTFLFCRELRIGLTSSLLAAIAFAFSGAVMVGPGHAYASSLVWLPAIMWAGERLLNYPQNHMWPLVAGASMGLSMLGGHPETTFHILVPFGLYFISKLFFIKANKTVKFRMVLSLILAVATGLLVGAVQWVPFANFLSQSSITSRSRSWQVDSIFYSSEWKFNAFTLLTLLYPNFFGNPADHSYFWPFSNYQNYLEQSMYFGLIPVSMAVGAMFSRKREQSSLIIITILAFLCLCVALRVPGFESINYLPIFNKVNNTRLKWIFTFLGAVLAGLGLDKFRTYILSNQKENRRMFSMAALTVVVAFAVLIAIIIDKYLVVPAIGITTGTFRHHLLFTLFSLRQARTTISIIVVLTTIVAYWFFRKHPQWILGFEVLLIALTFAELMVVDREFNTTVPKSGIFPDVKLIRKLKDDDDIFRIMSVDGTFWPNYGAVYGLFHVGGLDLPVYRRYSDLYLAQGGTREGYKQIWAPDWPLVDWMNVKYVLGVQDMDMEKLEPFFAGSNYIVYKNKAVLPRAYMVYDVEVSEDSQAVLHELTSGEFDFQHRVILERALPSSHSQMMEMKAGEYPNEGGAKSTIVEYDNERVVIDVFTPRAGVLVMSDLYAPGWKVFLDGQKTHLYRANYTFRAVFVPEGQHTVTFVYKPLDFQLGSVLSLLGLVILGIGIVRTWS